eukprot:GEZU01042404.1.p1 GENE.GEZU01042404.1~~GEZU01042404.1.p1  ORF type:complete len:304 (+),score=14.44 GEZU01042404.1:275-1186(+)
MDSGQIASHAYASLAHSLHHTFAQENPSMASSTTSSTAAAPVRRRRILSVIILGTNHMGYGRSAVALSTEAWQTPLGRIHPDEEIIHDLIQHSRGVLSVDSEAHRQEHSIENQLPFLQYMMIPSDAFPLPIFDELRIVPISIAYIDRDRSRSLANAISSVLLKQQEHQQFPSSSTDIRTTVLIATTDLTHAGPAYNQLPDPGSGLSLREYVLERDTRTIQAISRGNPDELVNHCSGMLNPMCGLAPVEVALDTLQIMKKASSLSTSAPDYHRWTGQVTLLKYAPSSDVAWRPDIVGFASFLLR